MLIENAIKSSSKRRAPVPIGNTVAIADNKDSFIVLYCCYTLHLTFPVPKSLQENCLQRQIFWRGWPLLHLACTWTGWMFQKNISYSIFQTPNPLLSTWQWYLHTSIILWENSLDELGQLGAIDEPWRKIHLKWQKSSIKSFFVKVYLEVVPHLDNLVLCKSWLLVKCFSLSLGSSTILEWIDFSNISG